MDVFHRIETYQGEMVEFLQQLLRISSVRTDGFPGAPFGSAVAEALGVALAWGEREGFRTRNVNGYAGHIEYGEGEEIIGVLAHMDIVPAGDGWTFPPFAAEIHNGRIYGRGAIDDKGPAVAAMYALKALKEEGPPLRHRIRIILGCDEESRWECMDAYFKAEPRPSLGFTPDGVFPLVHSEKGRLGLTMKGKINKFLGFPQLVCLKGGSRANVVPDLATAFVRAEGPIRQKLIKEIEREAKENQITWTLHEEGIKLSVRGIASHASMPELGDNALVKLLVFLGGLGYEGGAWETVHLLTKGFKGGFDGSGFGIDAFDTESGALTMNLGVLHIEDDALEMELDIRFPRTEKGEVIVERLQSAFVTQGITVEDALIIPPHFVAAEHPLVQKLLDAYRKETGDQSEPLAIGGRTYATVLGTAVAFGPGFPGQPDLAHQRDESIAIEDLMRCSRIYARALVDLAGN